MVDEDEDASVYRTAMIRTLAAIAAAHIFLVTIYKGLVRLSPSSLS
jgi:hypothetical protein